MDLVVHPTAAVIYILVENEVWAVVLSGGK